MRTPRLPVVDWTDASAKFKWTRPFRRKTKSGFCACAITFQTQYNCRTSDRISDGSHLTNEIAEFSARARWCAYLMTLVLRPSKPSVCFTVAIATSDARGETENTFVVEMEFWKRFMILFSTCQDVFCWLLGLRRQQCCYVYLIVAVLWSVLAQVSTKYFTTSFQTSYYTERCVKCLFYIIPIYSPPICFSAFAFTLRDVLQ